MPQLSPTSIPADKLEIGKIYVFSSNAIGSKHIIIRDVQKIGESIQKIVHQGVQVNGNPAANMPWEYIKVSRDVTYNPIPARRGGKRTTRRKQGRARNTRRNRK
jgi:hypothetical protein